MVNCCLKRCKNDTRRRQKKDGKSYFRFPLNEIRREEWRIIVSKERGEECFKPKDFNVVCSDHFMESDMYYTNKGKRRLKKTAIPYIEEIVTETYSPQSLPEKSPEPLITGYNSNISSPTSSGLSSILDSPKTTYFKKTLQKCYKRLEFKVKEVRNLKKQNQRLKNEITSLKEVINDLKKKRFVEATRRGTFKNKESFKVVQQ